MEQDAGGRGDCGAISGGGDGSHGSGRRCLTAAAAVTINYPQEGPASPRAPANKEKREKAQTCQVKKEAQKFCREAARKSLLVGERNWRNLILRLIYFLFLAPNERAWWVGERRGGGMLKGGGIINPGVMRREGGNGREEGVQQREEGNGERRKLDDSLSSLLRAVRERRDREFSSSSLAKSGSLS